MQIKAMEYQITNTFALQKRFRITEIKVQNMLETNEIRSEISLSITNDKRIIGNSFIKITQYGIVFGLSSVRLCVCFK